MTGCNLAPQATPELPKDNRLETAIENHLTNLELNGRRPYTITQSKRYIKKLSKYCNVFDSVETKLYILRLKRIKNPDIPLNKGYLRKIIDTYGSFCESNQIPFDKPKIRYEAPVPLIPNTDQVNDIINTRSAAGLPHQGCHASPGRSEAAHELVR